MTQPLKSLLASLINRLSSAVALWVAVCGLVSMFPQLGEISAFIHIMVEFYRKLVYPIYEALAGLISIPIPNIARDIYSASYSLAVCMFLSRGYSSGVAGLLQMLKGQSIASGDGNPPPGPVMRIAVAAVGSLFLAALAPGLMLLAFCFPKTRLWGLDAIRVYGQGLSIFMAFAVLNHYYEQLTEERRQSFVMWWIPIVNEPIARALVIVNAAFAVLMWLAIVARKAVKARILVCVMTIERDGSYQLREWDGLFVLWTNLALSERTQFAAPRLSGELDLFFSEREYVALGRSADPVGRQTLFIADTLVVIDMRDEDFADFSASIVPILQRNRLSGRIPRRRRDARPAPRIFHSILDLTRSEPRLQAMLDSDRRYRKIQES